MDGNFAHGERTMNGKRFLILAVFGAIATFAMPAAFAATQTNNVTIEWNTQAVAALSVYTDYNSAGTFNTAAANIWTNTNTGSGTCTATDASPTNDTANFSAVSPDFTQATDCLYQNAVNAQVKTNSTNWNLAAKATSGYPGSGFALCAVPNGQTGQTSLPYTVTGTFTTASLSTHTSNASVPADTSTSSCPAGQLLLNGTGGTLATSTTAFSSSPANIGMDIELVVGPNAPTGAQIVVEQYTLTAN
jgi:hypothetical protein